MIKNNTYLKKIIINCSISAILICAAVFGFIMPTAGRIIETKDEISKQIEELEENYLHGQSLRKVSEDMKTVEPNIEKLSKIFITKEDALNFVTSLERVAETSGVTQKIGDLNYPADSKKKTSFQKAPLQLTSTGNFKQQMNYLTSLESLDYYINLKTLEISKRSGGNSSISATGENSNDNDVIDMQLKAETYWNN